MAQQIQLRRDTSSNWSSVNPILAQGELGIEINTGKFKLGDGTTAWNSLSYFGVATSTTISTTSPLTGGGDLSANRTLSIPQSNASINGYLSSTDWVTFNGKADSLGFTPENVANKSTNTSLGTSNTLYPTENAVKTYADTKLTNSMSSNKLLGRSTASTGVIEEITIGSNLSLASTTLSLGIAYETGTWTPTIQGTTTNGTATYTNQQGAYTRIGDLCFVTLWLNWSGGTGTGNLRVAGLPFTANATYYSSINVGWNINVALSANTVATCYANLNTTNLIMYTQTVGGGGAPNVAYDAAGNLNISGVYKIA